MEAQKFNPLEIRTNHPGLWRYSHALPVDFSDAITLGEGFTPSLYLKIGGRHVHIKQEQLFPTGSYKDRGATILISDAYKKRVKHVVQDSSGNAGCAIAAYAAKAKISCDIYVPEDTSAAKLAQIQMYGANLISVAGNREQTAEMAMLAAQKSYYASHCYNPLFLEGTKTFAYEICEQLNWKVPDVVVLPAGNGTLLLGAYIGFKHLLESHVISKLPKLVAIQAENCAPLYHAWKNNLTHIPTIETQTTLAEGIAIAKPYKGLDMIDVVHKTNGLFLTVSEDEILTTLKDCCRNGYYIEPTSAATIAGLIKAYAYLEAETWVSLFSGHGLKSTEKMLAILAKH
jgi:threonine synthase